MHKYVVIILEKKGIYIRFLAQQIMENTLQKKTKKNKVIDIWNRIPLNINCLASIKIFKRIFFFSYLT